MAIRLRAQSSGQGVLLKAIATQADAESIRSFFAEKQVSATVSPFAAGDYRVFLAKLTFDEFAKLLEGSNIEVMP